MKNKYAKMTQEDFDRHLLGILECMTAAQIIDVPGVYEALSEEFNNEVLQAWEDEQSGMN